MSSDVVLVIVVATALVFDFTNGFHDTANAIATSVSTRAMSPRSAVLLSAVLVKSCEQLAAGLEHLPDFKDLDKYWIEIHRLENEGDRISRDAVASLFSNGIDPMVVIRWKDMFAVLENAIDATETAAQIIEGIVIKNS